MALPFTLKSILRQKKNYRNSNIFTMQKYNLQKILQKNPKSFKILYLYNKSQVSTQAKISTFKNPGIKNRPIIYYVGAKIHRATILYNESKHNILALVGKANKRALALDKGEHLFRNHSEQLFVFVPGACKEGCSRLQRNT